MVVRTAKTILVDSSNGQNYSFDRSNVQNFRSFETHFLLGETSEYKYKVHKLHHTFSQTRIAVTAGGMPLSSKECETHSSSDYCDFVRERRQSEMGNTLLICRATSNVYYDCVSGLVICGLGRPRELWAYPAKDAGA